MASQQRELTMGYDDPRLGALLQQPVSTGGNAGIDWETMFPSLKPSIDASRAAYNQQASLVANNAGMEHLWPMFSQPDQYDPSGFPKQLIDSGQTTLPDLVNLFNQKVGGNRLKLLPNGQVSFTQDVEASDPWGALVNGVLMAGVGAMSGGFGLSDLMNGFGGSGFTGVDAPWGVNPQGAGMSFDPLADFGADYFSGADQFVGGLADAGNWQTGIPNLQTKMTALDTLMGAKDTGMSMEGALKAISSSGLTSAGKTALGRIMEGQGSAQDWASVLGTAAATGLGFYGANQQANSLMDIANQARSDRAPFLNLATGWAQNPESYYAGAPAQAAMKGVLQGLSVNGNPANNPTAMGLASEAGLRNWQNAVTGFGNLGLAGQDSRMALQAQAANADAGKYNAIGYGLDQLTQPKNSLTDLLKAYNITGLA